MAAFVKKSCVAVLGSPEGFVSRHDDDVGERHIRRDPDDMVHARAGRFDEVFGMGDTRLCTRSSRAGRR
jgi:hypothetical protein